MIYLMPVLCVSYQCTNEKTHNGSYSNDKPFNSKDDANR